MSSVAKWKDRGFWVSHHFYWQSLIHYFIGSARFRSFTFFSACDPAIDLGGMLDENKSDVYKILPQKLVPATLKVKVGDDYLARIQESKLKYPLIVKPNIGFRGYKVAKVDHDQQLIGFLNSQDTSREWLIQEYLNQRREFSLLFYRIPGKQEAGITSLIEKIYPSVQGNGQDTLRSLVNGYFNPFIDRELLHTRFSEEEWQKVIPAGEKVILDTIGNYSRGAKFRSMDEEITDQLIDATKEFFKDVKGLDFFRMDFKADSLQDYVQGKFGILEINGAKSEPLHIYDTKFGFADRVRIVRNHWAVLRNVANARLMSGEFKLPSTRYGLRSLFAIKKLVK